MIQWGYKRNVSLSAMSLASASSAGSLYYCYYNIPLEISFYNNQFMVIGGSKYSTGHISPFGSTYGSNQVMIFDVRQRDTAAVWQIGWVGIGRWK